MKCGMKIKAIRAAWLVSSFFILDSAFGETNSSATTLAAPSLPDAGFTIIRVFGALALVLGLFLGGVWFFRNWQRLAIQRGHVPKLNILETRSLGGRQAIFVVGYNQERFLIASSPTGVNLLSHLPTAAEGQAADASKTPPAPNFAQALTQVLKGK